MIRIPRRFFFIMDAHQGSVAIAIVGMMLAMFTTLLIGELYHLAGPDTIAELVKAHSEALDDEAKAVISDLPQIMWFMAAFCIFVFSIEAAMLYGVLKRKAVLLLPWLVLEAVAVLLNAIELVVAFDHPTFMSVLCGLLFVLFQLVISAYEILVVFASYRLLKADNEPPSLPFENPLAV